DKEPFNTNLMKFAGAIAGGSLMLVLIAVLSKTSIMLPAHPANTQIGLIKNLGKVLYTEYNLPFEIASILFLVAMIGAVILAKKNPHTT
ncbi:MAG: NADH-quinone oxidoreductase subunit J, partial [Sphingobacteriales bacterium]